MADPKAAEPKRVVPVLNNRASQIQIPGAARAKDGSLDQSATIYVIPGYNLIDEARWKSAKENPTVKMLLAEKIQSSPAPEAIGEKVGHCILVEDSAVDASKHLEAMGQDRALRFIDELFDMRLLNRLRETSASLPQVVQAALVKQIEKIEKPKQDRRAALALAASREG